MDSGSLIPANNHNLREVRSEFAMELNRPLAPVIHGLAVQDSVLREYFRVLRKRLWVVVGCVAVIVSAITIATLRSTRIYEAAGKIVINKADPVALNLKDSQGGNLAYDDPTDLDTEVLILRSDLLALQVIRELNLDKQLDPNAPANAGSGLQKTTDALQPDSPRTSALLAGFRNRLNVALVPGTRAIEIRYRSPDPDRAAQVVNTLMHTYVEQNFKTRFESTMQASDWLSKQLVDLQIKVETSQEKLVRYQKEHGILGIDEKQNIITSKLDELNKGLTAAESERMEKESLYRMVQSGDADTLAAASSINNTQQGGIATSSLLDKLREQEADLKIQVAELSTQFGPAYPKVVQLNNQIKEVDAQIQVELRKVSARLRGDYLASLQRENMLNAAMEKQKQEANKLNESAIEYSLLKRDLETNRTLYEGLLERLKEAGVTAGLRSNNFRIVDAARKPTVPTEPDIPRNLTFALALGLATGVGLAFVMEALDNTVRTPEQAQAISGLPSLGVIPLGSLIGEVGNVARLTVAASKEAVELVTQARPQSQMAESYRALRTSLLLTSIGAPPKVILVTSSLPQEGKTTTSMNTAIVLAQKGSRVLLIDADLRRPSVHKALGMGPRTGLSNVLTGSAPLHQVIVRSTLIPTLYILPAGTPPPNPAELLASTNMRDVLNELREQYDHIVIDTPPTLSVTDAVVLSTCADSVVLVIRSGQTTRQALRRSRDLLVRVNARIAGVLLNAADLKSADYYYYYEYRGKYGDWYYNTDGATDALPAAKSESSTPQASTGSA
jgi:succinoglycan biosynthesis transport protein ExoP